VNYTDKEKQEIRNNISIAEFMGGIVERWYPAEKDKDGNIVDEFSGLHVVFAKKSPENQKHFHVAQLKYHKDWNWVMSVLEKISSVKFNDGNDSVQTSYSHPVTFGMINDENGNFMVRINRHCLFESKNLIDATYMAITDYLNK